eukprot:1436532-Pyramimonas_sp.AAC.1
MAAQVNVAQSCTARRRLRRRPCVQRSDNMSRLLPRMQRERTQLMTFDAATPSSRGSRPSLGCRC